MPSYSENGVEVTDIVGSNSPVLLNTEISYQYFKFGKDTQIPIMVKKDSNTIVYIVSGQFLINNQKIIAGESLLISSQEVDQLNITAQRIGGIMICSGIPHKEPIYQHGPYVD